jgi:hypothetical protein
MLRTIPRLAVCSTLLATGIVVATPVVASASGTTLRGAVSAIGNPAAFGASDTVWFMAPANAPLVQPIYFVVQGTPKDGGFAYSFSIDSAPQSSAAVVEVAVNAQGQQLVAVGTPTATLTKELNRVPDASGSGQPPALPSGATLQAAAQSHGWFYTMWLDPLNVDLNEVVDAIAWSYDGVHVTSFVGSSGWNWSSWNGWHPVGTPYVGSYYNSNHTWATVYTNARFETTSPFPSPTCGTSDTYYYANNVYGGGNGQLSGGVNTWATSGCLFLLHYVAGTVSG